MRTHLKGSGRFFGLALVAAMLFFVAACDTSAPEAEQPVVEDATLEVVAEALAADLDLSPAQSAEIRQVLARHEGEGAGALWEVAAELNDRLTEEQKAMLFARVEARRQELRARVGEGFDGSAPMRGHRGRAGGLFRDDGPLAETLTEEQKTALAELRQKHREAMQALMAQRRDGTITPEALRAEMKRLSEEMRAEVEALLTDEQKALLEARRGERRGDLGARRGDFEERREERRAAMIEALGLTSEQAEALEALREKHHEAMQALREELMAEGSPDPQAVRAALEELRAAQREEMAEVLTDEQLEVVRLHRILTAKVMARHRPGGGAGAFRRGRQSGG